MNTINLESLQCKLNNAHPKQIINLAGNIKFMAFTVTYEYVTNRGNKKTSDKYLIINTYNPQYDISDDFNNWINKFNLENQHRQISNVKILESQCLGFVSL